MSEGAIHKKVERPALVWLLVAQLVAILPLFFYLPLWLPVVWLLSGVWRVQIYRGVWSFPGGVIKGILGLICVVALWLSYRGSLGVEPLIGFLVSAVLLKLTEVYEQKDVMLVLLVCFVLVAAQLLFSQNVAMAAYALFSLAVLVSALNAVFCRRQLGWRKQFFAGGKIFLQALPITVLLFVLVPRLGQLWTVPSPESTATTGFSDTMSPGAISDLIRSRDAAFRVTFYDSEGEQISDFPPPPERYWRGLVLDNYAEGEWRKQDEWRYASSRAHRWRQAREDWQLEIASDRRRYYSVLIEPHQHRWLFSLMAPVAMTNSTFRAGFTSDVLTVANVPVSQRGRYSLVSATDYRLQPGELSREDRLRNVQLPEQGNERTRELVAGWVRESGSAGEVVDRALAYFREGFTYTLNPPRLGTEDIDEFLFISRRGFCEHFSGSFTFMMRAAGIPARVVVGYQGGSVNSVENYMLVRQSDAHAWAEIWLPETGWTRIDPTAVVAPSRIERGIMDAVEQADRDSVEGPLTRMFATGILSELQQRWDAVMYVWGQQVLAYDSEQQKGLLDRLLGGAEYWRIALVMVGSIALLLALYVFLPRLKRRRFAAPEEKYLHRFLSRLARRGCKRRPGETPAQFARRAGDEFAAQRQQILDIAEAYEKIVYAGERDRWLPVLIRRVKQLPL